MGLSVRWMQPIQQQGRRLPSLSSVTVRFMCSSLVFCCLTVTFQQIHSLRASGVRLSHAARAFGLELSTFLRSTGNSCTVPPVICFASIVPFYRFFLIGYRLGYTQTSKEVVLMVV